MGPVWKEMKQSLWIQAGLRIRILVPLAVAGGDRPALDWCVLGQEKPTLLLAVVCECTELQSITVTAPVSG